MNQKKFEKISIEKVGELNGSTSEEAFEAWRDGFIYALDIIKNKMETCHMTEFIDEMEILTSHDLMAFKQ